MVAEKGTNESQNLPDVEPKSWVIDRPYDPEPLNNRMRAGLAILFVLAWLGTLFTYLLHIESSQHERYKEAFIYVTTLMTSGAVGFYFGKKA